MAARICPVCQRPLVTPHASFMAGTAELHGELQGQLADIAATVYVPWYGRYSVPIAQLSITPA